MNPAARVRFPLKSREFFQHNLQCFVLCCGFHVVRTNLAQKWDQYYKRFEYYIRAQNVTKDEQKKALPLHVAGEEVQDLFETLPNTGTTYAEALVWLVYFGKNQALQ